MSDAYHYLFGGNESTQQSTQTPVDMTPGAFTGLRDDVAGQLRSIFQQGGGPTYSGPLVAGLDDAQRTALSKTAETAYNPGRNQYLNDTMSGKYMPGQPGANPFFDEAVTAAQRSTIRGGQEMLRGLGSKFAALGHQVSQPNGSSAFARAANVGFRGQQENLADIAAKMGNDAYSGERGRQQQAVQLQQGEVDTLMKNLKAQSLPQEIADTGVARGIGMFNQKIQSLMQALQLAGNLASPHIANQGQSTGESEGFGTGVLGTLFPKGLQGGGAPAVPTS